MPLKTINERPRSLPGIQAKIGNGTEDFVIMDIGARGGVGQSWGPMAENATFICFEADDLEASRVNAMHPNIRCYPIALNETTDRVPFYLANNKYCHALSPMDESYFGRFATSIYNSVRKEIPIETKCLDDFLPEESIERVDFIKLDVEGHELNVLRGGERSLRDCHVLGILTEVWFDPRMKGQPSYAELDTYLREQGFYLFDLESIRISRNTLPAGHLDVTEQRPGSQQVGVKKPDEERHGQICGGDALYFRDPVYDHINGIETFPWDADTLLRLVAFLDVFNYQDFAIEVLDYFRDTLLSDHDVDAVIADLVPPIGNVVVSYERYWTISRDLHAASMIFVSEELRTLQKPGYIADKIGKKKP